jgi:hypothetical protein
MNSLCLEHVSEDLLERYLAQQGSESEVEVVETHLLICEACRGRLDELEDYRSVMRQGFALLASQPARGKRQRRGWLGALLAWNLPRWSRPWLLIPAAVVLVLAGFLVVPAIERAAGPVDVWLVSERGNETAAIAAPQGHNLRLHLDSSGLPDGQVWAEIVDSTGNTIRQQQGLARSTQVTIGAPHLTSGVYYARIYSSKDGQLDSDRLLREFGFQVR